MTADNLLEQRRIGHPLLPSSDIEVLVALEKRLAFARDLYRSRTALVDWDAYPVGPHLVHLPPPGESVDGVAPFARDLIAQA